MAGAGGLLSSRDGGVSWVVAENPVFQAKNAHAVFAFADNDVYVLAGGTPANNVDVIVHYGDY